MVVFPGQEPGDFAVMLNAGPFHAWQGRRQGGLLIGFFDGVADPIAFRNDR
jgi:hypothetical protein